MDGIDHRDDQKNALPAGFTVRRARPSDAAAVTALVATSQEELHGEAEVSKASVLAKWQAPRFDLNRDAWLIETEAASTGGRSAAGPAKAPLVVAFGAVRESSPGQFEGNLTVHPRFAGRGLGAYVLARLEDRVREAAEGESDGSAVLHTWSSSADTAEVALYLASGFERVAAFSRMEKELGTDTEEPMWPPGIEPRAFRPGEDDRAVFTALVEAFGEDADDLPDAEQWSRDVVQDPRAQPALWLLACEGERVAGVGDLRAEGAARASSSASPCAPPGRAAGSAVRCCAPPSRRCAPAARPRSPWPSSSASPSRRSTCTGAPV